MKVWVRMQFRLAVLNTFVLSYMLLCDFYFYMILNTLLLSFSKMLSNIYDAVSNSFHQSLMNKAFIKSIRNKVFIIW